MYATCREFLNSELSGWKRWEIIWLIFCCASIIILSLLSHDSLLGIVSATTGVLSVICTGKGKLSAFLFGAVNTLLYSIISYRAAYYGEMMLNLGYYFPMQFYGFWSWRRNINPETFEVRKRRLSSLRRLLLLALVVLTAFLYGLLLRLLGGSLPFLDALCVAGSLVTMIVSVKMYMEQWILWIIIDALSLYLWIAAYLQGTGSVATMAMWLLFLANGFIMYFKWKKEAALDPPTGA